MEGRSTVLKKKSWKKKCWMEIQKRVDILTNLENTSYYLPSLFFYFIPFAFTLHYVLIKSLFDLEDCVVQILIWLNKKCGINSFWHPFMRLLVLSCLSIFNVVYMWGVWFCLHYSAHIYCWQFNTPFQSDFICWVITPERFELKHTFK